MKGKKIYVFLVMCVFTFLTLFTPVKAQDKSPRFQYDELLILCTQESFIPTLERWKNPDKVYTIMSEEGKEYHVYEYSNRENNPKILQKFETIRLYFGVDPEFNFHTRDYWRLLGIEFVKPPMPEYQITQVAEKYLGDTSNFKLTKFYSVWYVYEDTILLLQKRGKKIKRVWIIWHKAVDLIDGKKARKSINRLYEQRGEKK